MYSSIWPQDSDSEDEAYSWVADGPASRALVLPRALLVAAAAATFKAVLEVKFLCVAEEELTRVSVDVIVGDGPDFYLQRLLEPGEGITCFNF